VSVQTWTFEPEHNTADHWLMGISPEGIGTVGMLLNVGVAVSVASVTPPPPAEVQALVEDIRVPRS
jgi:cation/acetate symporter